jgi:hypothetical protein
MTFLKKLQLGKIAAAVLMGTILFVTTACNSGNEVGARPDNPPVQAGGQNNPHKAGGDGYTQYKMTTDPATKSGDRASVLTSFDQLLAIDTMSDNSGSLLYPGATEPESASSKDDFVSRQRQKELMNPGRIPSAQQPIVNRADPDYKILEKAGQAFKDASEFLTESDDVHQSSSDWNQVNPTRERNRAFD